MSIDISTLSADEISDANARAHEYVGKPIDQCTHADLQTIRDGLNGEKAWLDAAREIVLDDLVELMDRLGLTDDGEGG